ncbi:MAG: PQQ-like beta-propeller repeat protein [Thermoanaerobaculia bacterium]|nr:PQQ-like beta-propeller repeat protein [Thermoanaerobaculia bacterium]
MSRRSPCLAGFVLFTVLGIATGRPAVCDDEAMQNWPTWRGPLSTAVAPHADPPAEWSETKNVLWKVKVPGNALATPAVWGDRIFLMTTVAEDEAAMASSQRAAQEKRDNSEWPPAVEPVGQSFVVMALSTDDGSELWRRAVRTAVPHEAHYIDSSWASASPVTDGERIYAHFGSNGTYATTIDGELIWEVDLGDQTTRNAFGEGASPALHEGKLVVPWDHEGDSFLVVLDAASGEEIWRVERPGEPTSWATPTVVEVGDKAQIVLPGTGRSRGYDLATGEELWSLAGMTTNIIPSPPVQDGVAFLASGFRGNKLQAVDLAKAKGALQDGSEEGGKRSAAVLWSRDRDTPYVPSLVLASSQVCFLKHYKNIWTCVDAHTGGEVYQTRIEPLDNVWSSPVAAAGRIYILSREGKTAVLKAGGEYELLATNELDDRFDATPVLVGDRIYLRGREHLYAIGQTASASEGSAASR